MKTEIITKQLVILYSEFSVFIENIIQIVENVHFLPDNRKNVSHFVFKT